MLNENINGDIFSFFFCEFLFGYGLKNIFYVKAEIVIKDDTSIVWILIFISCSSDNGDAWSLILK